VIYILISDFADEYQLVRLLEGPSGQNIKLILDQWIIKQIGKPPHAKNPTEQDKLEFDAWVDSRTKLSWLDFIRHLEYKGFVVKNYKEIYVDALQEDYQLNKESFDKMINDE
jgi:hypothetical protein